LFPTFRLFFGFSGPLATPLSVSLFDSENSFSFSFHKRRPGKDSDSRQGAFYARILGFESLRVSLLISFFTLAGYELVKTPWFLIPPVRNIGGPSSYEVRWTPKRCLEPALSNCRISTVSQASNAFLPIALCDFLQDSAFPIFLGRFLTKKFIFTVFRRPFKVPSSPARLLLHNVARRQSPAPPHWPMPRGRLCNLFFLFILPHLEGLSFRHRETLTTSTALRFCFCRLLPLLPIV